MRIFEHKEKDRLMKKYGISPYDEFNKLQEQQRVRDYAHDVYHNLICLEQLVKRKDKKQIRDMIEGDSKQ